MFKPACTRTSTLSKVPADLLMSSQEEREILFPINQNSKRKAVDAAPQPPQPKVPKPEKQELLKYVQQNRNDNTTKKTGREVARFINYLAEKDEKRELTLIPPELIRDQD